MALNKILLKGYYGFGNLGDDILMKVVYLTLSKRFPRDQIAIFSNYTENLGGFEKIRGYNHYIYKLLEAEPALVDWTHRGSYEFLIDGGGGIYFGHTTGKWHHRIINFFVLKIGIRNTYRLDRFLRKISGKQKRLHFSKRIGLGIGVGEYKKSFPHFFSQFSELGSCSHLFVRDAESEKLLFRYSFRGKVQVGSDLAFLSKYWLPRSRIENQPSIKSIAVILLDFEKNAEAIMSEMLAFEDQANGKGYIVTYFSIDDVKDKMFRDKFKHRSLMNWQPEDTTLSAFLSKLSEHTVVISARAHGAILGACLGLVPVIIPHSQKLVQIAKMFPALSVQYDLCARGNLLETIDRIFFNLSACQQALLQDVRMNEAKAESMVESFLKVL